MEWEEKPDVQTDEGQLIELAMKRQRPEVKATALARQINVSSETMRNWIKGYRSAGAGRSTVARPDTYTLAHIAQILGINVGELQEIGRNDAAQALLLLPTPDQTVRPAVHSGENETDELRFRRPENVSDDEWERVKAAQQGYWAAQLDQVARER